MRPTRFEMINELRRILGHNEETEHVIDWVQDAWQTYDVLIECVGRERAHQIINAMDILPDVVTWHDLTSYGHANEHASPYLLN
jgi:hypothetical protein